MVDTSHSKCFCKKVDQLNFYRQFSATWQLVWCLISQKCLQGARTFSQFTLPPGHERLIIFIQIKLYYYLLSSRHLGVPIHWKNWGEDYAHHNTATPDFQTFQHPSYLLYHFTALKKTFLAILTLDCFINFLDILDKDHLFVQDFLCILGFLQVIST